MKMQEKVAAVMELKSWRGKREKVVERGHIPAEGPGEREYGREEGVKTGEGRNTVQIKKRRKNKKGKQGKKASGGKSTSMS